LLKASILIHIGTSGYSYKEWKGKFYPDDLPARKMLEFYRKNFNTVEINNTFYRMPDEAVLEGWAEQVPPDFKFVLKAPRRITHFRKLDDPESVSHLFKVAAVLGKKLGPVLFQLPPFLRKDIASLKKFLDSLPSGHRAAMEFRHASWFDDEIFGLMRKKNAALCVADADDDIEVPLVQTADFAYFRLRRPDYSTRGLEEWAGRLDSESYVFFKHEDAGKGAEYAKMMQEILEKRHHEIDWTEGATA